MNTSPLPEPKRRALERFLKAVVKLPADVALYASVLGVVALMLSGGASIAGTVVLGVGINAITILLTKLAGDEELSEEEISGLVQDALAQSGIRELEQQNQNILVHLLKESRAIEQAVRQGDNETGKLLIEQIKLLTDRDNHLNQISDQLVTLIESYQVQALNQQKMYQLLEKAIPALGNVSFPNLAQLDDQPIQPTIYAPRTAVINEWQAQLAARMWIAIVDGPGRGKSQLARAISELYEASYSLWVSLPDYENVDLRQHFRQQLSLWLFRLDKNNGQQNRNEPASLHDIATFICAALGDKGVLLVDNLPDPAHNEGLYNDLEVVAQVFNQQGAKIVTTSQRDLPQTLRLHLGNAVLALNPPPFSQKDVVDILQSAGATQEFLQEKIVTILLGVTEGHPSLLAATVYWLKQQNWHLGTSELENLLSGTPMQSVREEERRRMLSLLEDHAKELVYRLSLLYGKFDAGLIWKVAEVDPAILYPAERVDTLTGPWLTRFQEDSYRITPLLKDIGRNNLASDLKKKICRIAADYYIDQGGSFSVERAFEIAMYFWGAESYKEFATFTIQLMRSAETPEHAKYIDWTTFVLSPDRAWPDELDLDLRIVFRTTQIRTRILAGRTADDLQADLDKLTKHAGPDNVLALLVAYYTNPLQDFASFLHAIPTEKLGSQIIQLLQFLRQEPDAVEEISGDLERIIWTLAVQLKGKNQVEQFLAEVDKLAPDERQRLFNSDIALESIQMMIDSAAWIEENKPSDQQNWHEILSFASQVEGIGSSLNLQPLRIAGIRAQAVVLADHLNQTEEALKVLRNAADGSQDDVYFLIKYTSGSILSDEKQTELAIQDLEEAVATSGEAFTYFRFDARRRIALLYSMSGQFSKAQQWLIDAIHHAKTQTSLVYHRLELMGELAWVHWSTSDKRKACAALYGLIYGLLANEDLNDPRFREVFKKTGHAMGWYILVSKTGSGPASTNTGDVYTPVEAGFFGIIRERLGESTLPAGFSSPLLLTQIGLLCEDVELYRTAWKVYRRVSGLPDQDALTTLHYLTATASLTALYDDPTKAIEIGVKAVKVWGATEELRTNGRLSLGQKEDFENIWNRLDSSRRKAIEKQMFLHLALGPVFTQLLASNAEYIDWVLKQWEEALTVQKESFESFEHWISILEYFRQLLTVNPQAPIPASLTSDSLFQILQQLTSSTLNGMPLSTSLKLHITSVDYILQLETVGRYFMLGISQFLYDFWGKVAEHRGFSLNSPQLFREELSNVSLRQSKRAAVKILLSASAAVGLVGLPDEILERFRNAEK